MSILPDYIIAELARNGMIEPFADRQNGEGRISSGVSSYGYDAVLDPERLLLFDAGFSEPNTIDPKAFNPKLAKQAERINGNWIIPAYGFALGCTKEYFRIPRDVLAICMGKSTYARCGLIVNVTPLEPEWEGQVTLELHNTTSHPIKVYADEGICQFIFIRGEGMPEVSYADRKGKYQGQRGITLPRILGAK